MTSYTDTYEEREEPLEEGSMSFLDHLDELRSRLIRVAGFVMIAFVICWIFSDVIYGFLQVPVQAAMFKATRSGAPEWTGATTTPLSDYVGREVSFPLPTDTRIGNTVMQAGANIMCKVEQGPDGSPQLVTVNPVVVNSVTVIPEGYVIPAYLYGENNMSMNPNNRLVVGTVQGAFNLYIKVSFYAAIFFGVPFILTQVWGFVAPGLYPHEKKYAIPIIVMATAFFLLGAAFAYYIAFPRAADFLLGVAAGGKTPFRPLVTADDYFDLIITIMLGLGVVFEIPTVTFFTARLGLVTPRLLLKVWRYAVIAIFILAAVLSPTTDVPNLLVFAAPMLILYFLSVGIAWVFHRKRKTEEEYQALERKTRG
ncbi:MAG TPA: twin-arginine translocase subunit TatC [Blastocatellia bacterium]|nr:twin-arginine translocase subunit TatC [Blastocatellia bacterium]